MRTKKFDLFEIFIGFIFIIGVILFTHGGWNAHLFYKYVDNYQQTEWLYTGTTNNIQEQIVQKEMKECITKNLNMPHIGFFEKLGFSYGENSFVTKDASVNAYGFAEADCSKQLVEKVGLASGDQAQALIYLLINKGVSVPDDYQTLAKQNDDALANINLN
jgi:hypothetical protein